MLEISFWVIFCICTIPGAIMWAGWLHWMFSSEFRNRGDMDGG